jgi:TPR repeat protein
LYNFFKTFNNYQKNRNTPMTTVAISQVTPNQASNFETLVHNHTFGRTTLHDRLRKIAYVTLIGGQIAGATRIVLALADRSITNGRAAKEILRGLIEFIPFGSFVLFGIDRYVQNRRDHEALAIYSEAFQLNIQPNRPLPKETQQQAAQTAPQPPSETTKDRTIHLYTEAASKGNAQAMYDLGELYAEEGNHELAREWYQRASDHENPYGMSTFARLIEDTSIEQAVQLYQKLIQCSRVFAPVAKLRLAEIYAYGKGSIPANRQTSWDLYAEAAEENNIEALFKLGELSEQAGDKEQAAQFYLQASEQGEEKEAQARIMTLRGNNRAMLALGKMYAKLGNKAEAMRWFQRAAKANNTDASQWIKDYEQTLEQYRNQDR